MWNDELKALKGLLYLLNHDLQCLVPIWAQFSQLALMLEIRENM